MVRKKMSSWTSGGLYLISEDPEIREIAHTESDEYHIRDFMHLYLFYEYRNYLIHEFRHPGYGMEFKDIDTPYYHSMSDSNVNETFELVYPISFFEKIARNIVSGIRGYFIKNNIDPYSLYKFGTIW